MSYCPRLLPAQFSWLPAFLLAVLGCLAWAAPVRAEDVDVYLFAGQSNMWGTGTHRSDLPASLQGPRTGIWILNKPPQVPSIGWYPLNNGVNNNWDGDSWGAEAPLTQLLASRSGANPLYVIKVSAGGSALEKQANAIDWNPGSTGELLDELLGDITLAVTTLKAQGKNPLFRGFIWMQGETECDSLTGAQEYQTDFEELVRRVRATAATPALPVYMGRVRRLLARPYVDIVRVQEALIAAADPYIYLFDTDDNPMQSDNIHFAPAGHLAIGNAIFALITGAANQQPTQIASGQSFSLRAASGPGTVVGTVALTQTGSPTPTFAVAGSAFEIDGFTGKVRVKDLSGITQSQLQLSVSALNGVAPSAQANVTLNFTADPPGIQGLFATLDPNSSGCSLVSGCYQEIFDATNTAEKYIAPAAAQRPVAASFPGTSVRSMSFDTSRVMTGVNGNTLLTPAVDEDLTIAATINIPVHTLSTTAWIATLNKDATSVATGIGYDYAQNKFFAGYANGFNGTNEILTSTLTITPGTSHVVRLRKVGNTVRLFIDGTLAGEVVGPTVRPAIFASGEGAAPVVLGGLFAPVPQFKGFLGKTYFVKGIPTTTEETQMDSDLAAWMGSTVSPPPPPPSSWTLNVSSGSGSGSYTAGTVVPVSANAPPSGSQFAGWIGDTSGLANASAASTTLTMPNAAATLTATYTVTPISVSTWTLTVSHGTGSGSYTAGAVIPVVADAPPAGSQFAGWVGDTSGLANASAASTTFTMPNAAATLTATYTVTPISVSIWTLTVSHGTGSGSYTAGSTVSVVADAPPAGSQFAGWVGDTSGLANPLAASTTLTMPNAAITLTATYSIIPPPAPTLWTLTVSHGTGGGSYTAGSTVSVVADTPPAGSQFAGWVGDTSGLANPLAASTTLTMPNAAAALTATYSIISTPAPALWTLTISHGTGSGSYTAGTSVSIVADAPPAGSQFAGWIGDTSGLANPLAASTTLTMPNAAATLTATYTPIPLAAPTNLSAQRVASHRTWLFWNDNTTNETGYQIEWKNGSGPFVLVATVGPNSTAYYHDVATMASNIVYTYRVRAISQATASSYSNEAQVKIGTTGGSALQYLLTVNGGSGSGSYNATTLVPISAAAVPAGQVFTGWTGTTAVLADPHAANTTAKMPAHPLTVTATYGPALSSYQQWKLTYLGSSTVADTAIPDKDGIPVLLKYATAMIPGTPSPSGPAMLDSFNNTLTLQFKRLSPAPIDYTVEASTDLIHWTAITHLATGANTWTGKANVSETASGSPRITTVRDVASMATGPHRFLRLRVGTGVPGTIPQGYIKITIGPRTTATMSIPLDDAPVARGDVQAVTPSTITTTAAGAWDNVAAPYALRLVSGKAAGATFPIIGVNGTTLSLNTSAVDLTQLVATGDSYVVFPADTIGTLFGTTKVLFKTGATAATADNLQLWINGEWITFFHNGNAWYNTSDPLTSQNNVLLSPDTGLLVLRRSSPALVFTVLGRVHEVAPRQFVPTGSTLLANPHPIDVRLASTGFRTAPGWITGPNSTAADSLQAWNGKSWLTFFHNGTTWRKTGSSASMDNYLLPAGQAVFVTRHSDLPRDQMFILQPLPYSP
jgi:hypothetical protein